MVQRSYTYSILTLSSSAPVSLCLQDIMPSVMKIILGLTLNLPTLQPPPVENRLISYYRILCSNTKTVLTFI